MKLAKSYVCMGPSKIRCNQQEIVFLYSVLYHCTNTVKFFKYNDSMCPRHAVKQNDIIYKVF